MGDTGDSASAARARRTLALAQQLLDVLDSSGATARERLDALETTRLLVERPARRTLGENEASALSER